MYTIVILVDVVLVVVVVLESCTLMKTNDYAGVSFR